MQSSLAPASAPDAALGSALRYVEQLALGPVAVSIAIIAVAVVGLLMLNGRVHYRRAARVVLGCFILFGAPAIASGLLALAFDASPHPVVPEPARMEPPNPMSTSPVVTQQYDPYAGASVPIR